VIEHKRTQFIEPTGTLGDKLCIGSFGPAGSGKTRFILTMPGKVGVIPLDRKSRRTIERGAGELGLKKGKIIMPKDDLVRLAKPMALMLMSNDAAQTFYREHINRVKDAIFTLAEDTTVESIAIDTGTQLAEDVLFANYGRDQKIMPRDRGAFNSEMKQILVSIQHKQVIVTHEARAIWINDKPTSKNEWTGWSKLDYNTNIIVEHVGPPDSKDFELWVRLCQDRPEFIGEKILEGEEITFPNLANVLYPEGGF
jgi:hypothetical protein